MNRLEKKMTATLLIAIFMISAFTVAMSGAVLVQPIPYLVLQTGDASATWSTTLAKSGIYSVYVDSGPNVGTGDVGRIRFVMPPGTTLGDIDSISWKYFHVAGYPPHVDLYLDTDGNTAYDDCLTFEYAENGHTGDTPPTYGALIGGSWYTTFSDDGQGPAVVDDGAIAWSNSGGNVNLHSLLDWKAGQTYGGHTINENTIVIYLQVESDRYLTQCQSYIDDIEINGVTYDLEPDPEVGLEASPFLYQITATSTGPGSITPTKYTGVEYDQWKTFTIDPDDYCYVSQLLVDGAIETPAEFYAFNLKDNVKEHTIDATFAAYTIGISVAPLTVDFGQVPVGGTAERTVTVSNTGDVPVMVGADIDRPFFQANLKLNTKSYVSGWDLGSVDDTLVVNMKLTVPTGTNTAVSYSGTLVFEITPPPP